jgi:hypothetical protein
MPRKIVVPAQLLLSIAIQESGCRKDVRGGGGEMGLMQAAANRCASGNIASCMEPYSMCFLLLTPRRKVQKADILLLCNRQHQAWS